MVIEIAGGLAAVTIVTIGAYLKDRFGCKNSRSYVEETSLSYRTIRDIYYVNKSRWKYTKVLAPGYDTIAGGSKVLLYNSNKNGEWPENMLLYNSRESAWRGLIRVNVTLPTWILIKVCGIFKNVPTVGTEMVLESAQRDIDKLKFQATKELEEANRQMLTIRDNLKKEKEEAVLTL